MALKSITGTTSEIQAALTANKIGIETSVTITDDSYESGDLLDIIAKTNKTITLQKTAAWSPISADAPDLVKILAQVNKYTGPITVTAATDPNPTAEQLNYIAKKTTGTVTATLDENTLITKATVDALKDVNSSDNISFKPTTQATVTGKSDLEALVALSKKLPNTVWTDVTDFKGAASEVAAIKAALKVFDAPAVTITSGQISAADANALVVASEGNVTATIKDGSVAATLNALKDVADDAALGNTLTFKSTDKTADAKALVDLDALLGTANTDFSSVQTITSKATDVASVEDAITAVGNTAINVTITGAIDAADAGAISDKTTGKVTATIKPGEAADIATDLDSKAHKDDALNITVNGDEASVDNLKLIDAQTALKVKVDAATVTATNYAQFEGIYVTNKNNFSNLGDENITIAAGAADMNSAKADIVAKATSKVVTATITGESAATVVTNLKNANAKDAFTITLLDVATSAKDLLTLDGKTSVAVDASGITTSAITGTVAEINKLLVADVDLAPGATSATSAAFTLTGTVKAADANYIALKTDGVVTATIAADTAAKLDAALANAKNTDLLKLTVNGATAAVTELNNLVVKTDVTKNAIKVDAKEITGTQALLATLFGADKDNFIGEETKAVKITGTAAAADVNTILNATTGVVTAIVTADTASDLNTNLANATAKDALTLTVNADPATTAAHLLALDDKTAVKVNAKAVTAVTGSAADLKKLVAAKGVEVDKFVDITVDAATATTASDLATILKSTLGKVTATNVTADTAAKLNAALKDANSLDALTLKVNGTTATAKDLISLDGKTSATITLNVGAITGNITEITKVFVDSTTIFTNVGTTAATISGEITAAQADAVADKTSGVVTATIKADTAKALNDALSDTAPVGGNAYKLTVNDITAKASDLNGLDAKTSITVNAAAIKNIEGTATAVKAAYDANADKTISGLGNETVDLSAAIDANASLVRAINDYTTGVITLDTVNTASTGGNFSLSQLGDLKGITGLVGIVATHTGLDTINISLKDLLAANDTKGSFTFNVTGTENGTDVVNITNDLSGWTKAEKTTDIKYTYTNDKTGQMVTIEADQAVINA